MCRGDSITVDSETGLRAVRGGFANGFEDRTAILGCSRADGLLSAAVT